MMMKTMSLLLLLAVAAQASDYRYFRSSRFNDPRGAFALTAPFASVYGRNPSLYAPFQGYYSLPSGQDSTINAQTNALIDEYIVERKLTLQLEQLRQENEELAARVEQLETRAAKPRRRSRSR